MKHNHNPTRRDTNNDIDRDLDELEIIAAEIERQWQRLETRLKQLEQQRRDEKRREVQP